MRLRKEVSRREEEQCYIEQGRSGRAVADCGSQPKQKNEDEKKKQMRRRLQADGQTPRGGECSGTRLADN